MIGSKLGAGWRCVRLRNIIAVKVVPKIAQGVNTLCHRVNMGDGGSGSWAPDRCSASDLVMRLVKFV